MNAARIACLSCLIAVTGAHAPVSLSAPADDAARRNPYALTISGGVSLGAYEAGVNWALLRYLKSTRAVMRSQTNNLYPDLVAITGASAGSINGLVSAVTWCAHPDLAANAGYFADRIDNNLFRDVWLPVGLDELLPADSATGYEPHGDGVFTRRAFDKAIARIRSALDENIFDKDCRLPFGLTVTSETPYARVISNVRVGNQRHFIPLTFEVTQQGRGLFRSRPVDYANPGFGNVIHLPPKSGSAAARSRYDVDNEAVINAVLASSAFPLAFGRRTIEYCYLPGHSTSSRDNTAVVCPKPLAGARDVFLDGGVFDNIPLGAAQALAEGNRAEFPRRVTYVFMDPDNRRPAVETDEPAKPLAGLGDLQYDITSQFQFLSGTVNTARSYELYKVLTSGDWNSQIGSKADYLLRIVETLRTTQRPDLVRVNCDAFFASLRPAGVALDAMRIEQTIHCLHELKVGTERAYQQFDTRPAQRREERRRGIGQLRAVSVALYRSQTEPWWREQLNYFNDALDKLESAPLNDRRILLSSRFFPITGEHLHAFGAFFDKPFREFDYYVGVYDAAHGVAQYWCEVRIDLAAAPDCLGRQMQAIYSQLEVARDPKAVFLFASLARLEHPEHTVASRGWGWLPEPGTGGELGALHRILDSIAEPDPGLPGHFRTVEFPVFVSNLRQKGYGDAHTSPFFLDIKDRGKDWWELPAARFSRRLHTLEVQAEARSGQKGDFSGTIEFVADSAELYYQRLPGFSVHQETEAGAWWPREIGIGASRGDARPMPYGSWEYRLFVLGDLVPFPSLHITPVQYVPEADHSSVLQIGLRGSYTLGGFRFGAGPDLNYLWHRGQSADSRFGVGLSAFLDLGHLRVTAGRRDLNGEMFAHDYKRYMNVAWLNLGDWLSK